MKNLIRTLAAGLVVLALSAQEVCADSILDQQYDPSSTNTTAWIGGGTSGNLVDWAQTFKVGETGMLTDVAIKVLRKNSSVTQALLLDIRTTSSGAPSESDSASNILFSTSIAASDIGTSFSFLAIDLDIGSFSVSDGDILAIVLRSDDTNSGAYQWAGSSTSGYADGAAYWRMSGSFSASGSIADHAFKTSVQTTPEPSTLVLIGLGIAAAAVRSRRTRRKQDSQA
ncbi:MAG: PEP-CTERM sorting domain-containing protein [Planctomycetota bacterium]|jgi:hypothetical protein